LLNQEKRRFIKLWVRLEKRIEMTVKINKPKDLNKHKKIAKNKRLILPD